MKFIFAALLLMFFGEAQACLAASQERIIPLGTEGDRLLALQISIERDGSPKKVIWQYQAFLLSFNADYSETKIKHIDSKAHVSESVLLYEERVFETEVNRFISKAKEYCQSLENFEAFEVKSINICAETSNCGSIGLVKAEQALKFVFEEKEYPILSLQHGNTFIGHSYKLTSSRYYTNNTYDLYCFHLARGTHPAFIPDHLEDNRSNTLFYVEPMPHHGHGFDYYILQRKTP